MSAILDPEVFRAVMEDLQVGVYFTDRARRIVFWNSGAERITGYLSQEVVGRCCRDNILLHCDHRQVVVCGSACPLAEAMADGKPREASLFLRHKTGHRIPIRIHSMPIRDPAGTIIGAAECFQRQRFLPHPERREGAADPACSLNGIPEYAYMISELRMRLARMLESGAAFGVLCVEVDHFEALRENRGHEACVTVLHVIANTLQNTVRPEDCLGAWSQGQLLLVLAASACDALQRTGDRLRALVSCSGVVWWGDPLPVTISVGGTVAKPDDNIETLISRAEHALETSGTRGGNCVTVVME